MTSSQSQPDPRDLRGADPYAESTAHYRPPYQSAPVWEPYQAPHSAYTAGMSPAEEANWAAAAHWLPIFTSFLGPLILWLAVGQRSAKVRAAAAESLNFEITFGLAMMASVLLTLVLIGIAGVILLPITWFVLRMIAAVRAGRGENFRYPVCLRVIRSDLR